MQELVFLQSLKDEPYTTPEIISEHTGIEYRSISDLIRRNKADLECFGVLRFEIVKPTSKKGGRPKKIYHLNEQQAPQTQEERDLEYLKRRLLEDTKDARTIVSFAVGMSQTWKVLRAITDAKHVTNYN